ncbi:hypothetical protein G6F68_018132 [Rhizopus microsporus]|nr:hypothetical protein G6F68_018132 [Rhizopus microsporus]
MTWHRQWRAAGARRTVAARAGAGVSGRRRARVRADHAGGIHALRPRPAVHADRHVQPAAGYRPAAAGLAVVRAGRRQPGVRVDPFRALGAGAEHVCGLPGRVGNPAHGGPQLWADGLALRAADPGAGRAAGHPGGLENRLGLRLAYPDRRGTGVRGVQR